eukprot:Sdes_comp19562_c0_seq2m11229
MWRFGCLSFSAHSVRKMIPRVFNIALWRSVSSPPPRCSTFIVPRVAASLFSRNYSVHLNQSQSNSTVGPSVTSHKKEAIQFYDKAVIEFLQFKSSSLNISEKASKEDSAFGMSHLLSFIIQLSHNRISPNSVSASLKNISNLFDTATTREKNHYAACQALVEGKTRLAIQIWESILVNHHDDILAILACHLMYISLGASEECRDSIARVLPFWRKDDPLYGSILSMYSFGLHEMGDVSQAEKIAHHSLERNPHDSLAIRTLAHIFLAQSKNKEGIDFLNNTRNDWQGSDLIRTHLYWNMALFFLDEKDHHAAFEIYDAEIAPSSKLKSFPMNLTYASSLLLQLDMDGYDVGSDRWQHLMDVWSEPDYSHDSLFIDLHKMILFTQNGTPDLYEAFHTSVSNFISSLAKPKQDRFSLNMAPTKFSVYQRIGSLLFQVLVDFKMKRFDKVVELLHPVRYQLCILGGSLPQRDIFMQILLYSAIYSKNFRPVAASLIAERKLLRPTNLQTDRMLEKLSALCSQKSSSSS